MPERSAVAWLWLTVLMAFGTFGADLALGPDVSLVGLLLVCPLLASTRRDGRTTAAVSGVTFLLAVAISAVEHSLTRGESVLRLIVLAAASGYATWVAHQSARHRRQLERVAWAAQQAVIRPSDFEIGGLEVSARYRSAAEDARIGGDLYAFAHTPTGLRLLIGDVRGKGLPAVHLAAAAIGHFRDAAYTQPGLLDVVREMDTRLARDLGPEDFVTAVVAEVRADHVRLANCGHHAPLHLRGGAGDMVLLDPPEATTPIGLAPAPFVQDVDLAPGDRLLFYTDGLAEARDRAGVMPDLGRIAELCRGPRLGACLDMVMETVALHIRRTRGRDDIALVLVQSPRVPPGPPDAERFEAPPVARRTAVPASEAD
ncbi:PP2C family protein-serine/threonine phosphatase [Streptomyces sp. NPDC001941]|uniref:PP2C family protein-serine/threonine phosphatase n=1 Tax=Streptomyces sp. NPDC001941 TaxID=3154659 RepID=UPI003333FBB4